MKKYELTKITITIEEETADTYGIANENIRFDDVSTDKKAVEALLAEINAVGNVEECHIWNIIEDNFGE